MGLGAIRPPSRMAFRLGLPSADVLAVTPESMPPQKVPQLPVTTDKADKARISYRVSAEALSGKDGEGGAIKWLDNIRAANWKETSLEVIRQSKIQYDVLVNSVRGRTGNSDAEYELELQWWGLWDRAYRIYKTPPAWLEEAADRVARFLGDFTLGAKQAWQGYSDWVISNAGPILKDYHGSLRRLSELKADFQAASASGNFSVGHLMAQEASLTDAEEALGMVRKAYATVSAGGDIDKLAIEQYGPYSMQGGPLAFVYFMIVLISIAALIALATKFLDAIDRMLRTPGEFLEKAAKAVKDNPIASMIGVAVIGTAIYFLTKSPDTKSAGSIPVPEAT